MLAACGVDEEADSSLEDLMESMDLEARMTEPEARDTVDDPTMREIAGADDDAIMQIANIEAFWADVGGEIGLAYEPLDSDRLFPRSVLDPENSIECSFDGLAMQLGVDLVRFNAFVAPCDEGITVAWDDIELKLFLDQNFPGAGFANLMAHEWGHVAQNQLMQFSRPTLLAEQEADCYAGAYLRWAEDNGREPFTTARARDLAIVSALESRDQVGTSPAADDAHGNGFDRVRASQDGYDHGVAFCHGYDEAPPPVTQMTFSSDEERATGGNVSLEEALAINEPALSAYFQSLAGAPIEAFLQLPDEQVVAAQHETIGDGAVTTLLGLSYAAAMQAAGGGEINGVGPTLQRACLLGSFYHEVLAGNIAVETDEGSVQQSLSPGDLDESILTFISSPAVISNPGLIFETVSAMRIGTVEGVDGCELPQ